MALVKLQTFSDGICNLYFLDTAQKPCLLLGGVHFANRVVGIKRHYEAFQADLAVARLIRIPQLPEYRQPRTGVFVVIGNEQYRIIQAQNIPETTPKSMDLTLEQSPLRLTFDVEEAGTGGRL